MRYQRLIPTLALAATAALCIAWHDGHSPRELPPAAQEKAATPGVPTGFQVSGATLVLRAQALDDELDYASKALETLGEESLDRVTMELLMAVARGRDEGRRAAAGRTLVNIGERAVLAGFAEFAGGIGEALYLSSMPADVRERAYPLFMLLDTPSAQRHRRR